MEVIGVESIADFCARCVCKSYNRKEIGKNVVGFVLLKCWQALQCLGFVRKPNVINKAIRFTVVEKNLEKDVFFYIKFDFELWLAR